MKNTVSLSKKGLSWPQIKMCMKKIFIIALCSVLSFQVFAQDEELVIASSKDNKVKLEAFDHIGYGYNFVKSDEIDPRGGEIFFNLFNLDFFSESTVGFQVGIDLLWDYFRQKNVEYFLDSDRNIIAFNPPIEDEWWEKLRGGFSTFSFNAPLLVKLRLDKVSFGAGVEGNWNITGDTYYRYRESGHRTTVNQNRAKVNPFSYGIIATLSFDTAGFFFKYHPTSSRLLPEDSLDFSFMSFGVAFNF